jgi:dinuclear metal center YbgI/SA1388 family protein
VIQDANVYEFFILKAKQILNLMKVAEIAAALEAVAPLVLQEDYDNAGLITGSPEWQCTGILCTLDVTPGVVEEAVNRKCNCIVAHHPIVFRGLKKINGKNYVEQAVIKAIKNDIAIYAAHTNLDNVIDGVNGRIADKLGLTNRTILAPKTGILKKLYTYVPEGHLEKVRDAVFRAGAGNISNYSECSFTCPGTGTFKPGAGTEPFSGTVGERKNEKETKLEVIFPAYLEKQVMRALLEAHPYEEVAHEIITLDNPHQETGSGIIGEIAPMDGEAFLQLLVKNFGLKVVRHTPLPGGPIKKVAVCGGAGSFLITSALKAGADAYVTGDVKYHEFFDAVGGMLLCDIGHYESEQFTTDLFMDIFLQKFPNFAVLKSEVRTNPVSYFTGK